MNGGLGLGLKLWGNGGGGGGGGGGFEFFSQYIASGVLYTDALGTDLVDTNGDPIGYITDATGNGHDLTQSTSALKPTWSNAPDIQCVSAGDRMDGVDPAMVAGDFTLCVTLEHSVSTQNYFYGEWQTVDNNHFINFALDNNERLTFQARNATDWSFLAGTVGKLPINQRHIIFVTGNYTTKEANIYYYSGGALTADAVNPIAVPGLPAYADSVIYGGGVINRAQQTLWNGFIPELATAQSIMTTDEMTTKGAEMASTWGVL